MALNLLSKRLRIKYGLPSKMITYAFSLRGANAPRGVFCPSHKILQGKKNATTWPQYIKYQKDGQTKKQIEYKYTSLGNHISEILYDGKSVSYTYSSDCNRLMSETNNLFNVSYSYTYSDEGNIKYRTDKSDWSRTNYTYNGDKLTKFGNEVCVYDKMGNPTTYRGKAATWKGRQMTSFNGVNFTYDGRGRRTGKGSITFLYDPRGRIIKQSNGLEFFYDFEGIAAVKYNSTMYFYQKDAQGNIIGILDSNGNVVVQYYYDAWGNHTVSGSNITLGKLNPFRYRGYYYDTETGLYFLQTRYYDPEVGRFLNRDSVSYADPETIGGLNLYAYCLNNPVIYVDPYGTSEWWQWFISGLEILAGVFLVGTGVASGVGVGLITLGAGSLINGAINSSNGGSFTGGWVGGQVAGVLSLIPVIGPAVGAFAGSVTTDLIDVGWDGINWSKAGWSAGIGFLLGMPYLDSYNNVIVNLLQAKNSILISTVNSIINVFWGRVRS